MTLHCLWHSPWLRRHQKQLTGIVLEKINSTRLSHSFPFSSKLYIFLLLQYCWLHSLYYKMQNWVIFNNMHMNGNVWKWWGMRRFCPDSDALPLSYVSLCFWRSGYMHIFYSNYFLDVLCKMTEICFTYFYVICRT